MQQMSSSVFNQNGRSQKKKSEGERGNPQRLRWSPVMDCACPHNTGYIGAVTRILRHPVKYTQPCGKFSPLFLKVLP